jgi:hypothetical protein
MGDGISLSDLGSAQSPLPGLSASDYGGYGTGGNQTDPSSGFTTGQVLGAGALGLGALGVGSLLAQGPGNVPQQYLQAEGQVPYLQSTGQGLIAEGSGMTGQGQEALAMAQAGQLTPEQQAQVSVYGTGLTNQARQMYSNMGVNPDQDTSFISTTADIDTKVNAMAQAQIQSTIQLGLGEVSGGNSLISQGSGMENAANQILLQAGQAQLQLDQQYSSSLSSAFGAIGSLFGAVAGASVGGPAGATAGSAAGGALGKIFS